MSKALARQLELAEVYLDEIGNVGGRNATLARRARDQVAHVRAALESEEVVAEGLADPDALADYNADRQHMLTIFKVRALRTDKPIRIVAVKEEPCEQST